MRKPGIRLGNVQSQIMRFLWDRGSATAREITQHLEQSQPIAHSTVQTLLRKLEAKGAIAHEEHERVFTFRPIVAEAELTASSVQELVSRAFQGSVSGLVAHLIKHEKISSEEMQELRRLIDEHEEQSR